MQVSTYGHTSTQLLFIIKLVLVVMVTGIKVSMELTYNILLADPCPDWLWMWEWPSRSLLAWTSSTLPGDPPTLCCRDVYPYGSSRRPSVPSMLRPPASTANNTFQRLQHSFKVTVFSVLLSIWLSCILTCWMTNLNSLRGNGENRWQYSPKFMSNISNTSTFLFT